MSAASEINGAGDGILFIHGLGGTGNVFGPQIATLSRSFKCIRFDLPGAGRSSIDTEVSIERFVETAVQVLETHGTTGPVHVVAHSMGTVIAQHLALNAPERVRSLSLLGPIHAPGEAGRKGLRDRATRARTEGLVGIADDIIATGLSNETRAHRPELGAAVREFIMRQSPEGYARHCEALAGAQGAELCRISAPVLLITGDEDNTSAPAAVATLQASWPGSSMALLGRCGHWSTLERPLEVTTRILDFLLSIR